MQITKIVLAVAASTIFAAGCSTQKTPANHAVEKLENSLAQVKEEAALYAPHELQDVQSQISQLNAGLNAKKYETVLADAPKVEQSIAKLPDAIDAGKAQAVTAEGYAKVQWESLSADVPKMVSTIEARVNTLSKAKTLPEGLTQEGVAGAKTALDSMKAMWAEANADARKGNTVAASSKAKTIQGIGEELYNQLSIDKA
jgi:PBP1b-binding outer membrane lipoprotein LpoB